MQHVQMDRYVIDISDERYEEYRCTSANDHDLTTKLMSFAIIDYQCIQQVVGQAGLEIPQTMRMLEAHGGSDQRRYLFTDMNSNKRIWTPVQEWIEQHDGQHDVVYVCVCNPAGYTLPAAKSILVYPATKLIGTDIFYQANGLGNNILNITPATI